MAANYPDWAQTWADFYHTTPQQIMANAGASNPYAGQFSEDAQMASRQWESMHPGFDINPATGRRSIDEFINPTGNAASDIGMNWVPGPNTGPKNFMERFVSIGAPLALGAMAGYGAQGAAGLLGSELGGGVSTVAGSSLDTVPFTTLPGAVTDATMAAGGALPAAGGSAANAFWPGLSQTMPEYAAQLGGASGVTGQVSGGLTGSGFLTGGGLPLTANGIEAMLAQNAAGPANPVATTGPTSGGTGFKMPTTPQELADLISKNPGAASSLLGLLNGGQSSTGGLLGGLLGAGLGYLDAKNQPDSLTIKNEIDPRLANLWYGADGTGGIAGQAANVYASQQGQPNPLMQAGQQISGMAGQTPDWATLVSQAKSQWDSNPWVQQQQDAITGKVTQNLLQNVMPNIGSGAESVGGYGGSRQGIAQGLAISNMNTDLAPALANLASNAYESSQNRALSSAGAAGNYGLSNQAQQAGLLGTGANMQSSAPWANLNNFRTAISGAPGNSSTTTPLFNNTTAGALGGYGLGSQLVGSVNWSDLFKTIGGWNWPFGSQNTTGVY